MVKAKLLESQLPVSVIAAPIDTTSDIDAIPDWSIILLFQLLPRCRQWVMNPSKAMNEIPKSCSDVQLRRNVGSPKDREIQGDGDPVVVSGWESHPQGEGGQVIKTTRTNRYA